MTDPNKLTLDELEEALARNPENLKLRIVYAEQLIEDGFLLDAQEEYKDLIKVFPDNAELYFNLGVTYEKQNDLDKALECFEQAAVLDPEDPDFSYNVAFMLDRKGDYENAIEIYQTTLSLNPEDSNAYFNLGYIYSQQNKHELAIEHFKKAKEINPDDIYARFDLAFEYKKINNVEDALNEYIELIEASPGYSWAHFNVGCILYEQGELEQAIEFFLQTVTINPKDIEAYKILSDIATTPREALEYLKTGLAQNPQNGELHYYISLVYEKMSDYENQLFHLVKATEFRDTLFINPLLVSDKIKEASRKVK